MLWLTRSLYVTGWRPIAFLWIMELCLEKEGKALMLFYFMRQFFTSHEKNTTLHVCWKISYAFFFLGTWEIKIDSLLFCASIERLFTLLSKGMQLMMPLFCLPKSQHFPLEIQLLCLSIRDASEASNTRFSLIAKFLWVVKVRLQGFIFSHFSLLSSTS